METMVLSVMIYEALNAKGAGLGDASIGIIESAIDEYEAAQPGVQADGATYCPEHGNMGFETTCSVCGIATTPRQ